MNKMRNKKRGSIGLELLISIKDSIFQSDIDQIANKQLRYPLSKEKNSTNDLQRPVQRTIRELEAFIISINKE